MPGIGYFASADAQARYFVQYDAAQALLPAPAEEREVPVAHGRVRVARYGPATGKPIVLLHGRAATPAMWAESLPGLAESHPVYTVDVLGEPGRSIQTAPLRGDGDQARWLSELLAALELRRVHLVGLSAGGWLAFNLAVHAPERLTTVTLLEPANVLARFDRKFLLGGAVTAVPGLPEVASRRFLAWVSGGQPPDSPLSRVLADGLRSYRMRLPFPSYPADEVLRAVDLPVLVLLGGRSVIHDPVLARDRALGLIPRAEAEIWPEASHALPAEHADQFVERELRFIKDHTV